MEVDDSLLSDVDLMDQLCAGQKNRLEILMRRYYQPLLRVAWSKLLHRQSAEDVVQETFVAVYGARESYNRNFSFRTWIWTILLNLCRRELKRQHRRSVVQNIDPDILHSVPPAGIINPENGLSLLLQKERRQQVVHALNQLPEPQADAIRLRFYGELAYDEISLTINCSLSGAKRRVKTGLVKLAELLQTEEEHEA
ncbi:MAG: RNA polymerase sigma factor [Planctomycetaceae bacterium]|nr:RNA polymerase sigma factor [Planctomycetaceae bacterium]